MSDGNQWHEEQVKQCKEGESDGCAPGKGVRETSQRNKGLTQLSKEYIIKWKEGRSRVS